MSTSETSHPGSEIAVVGMAGRLPGAANLAQFWCNLRDGVESITTFSEADLIAAGESAALIADPDYVRAQPVLADIDKFDAEFFGFSPQDAAVMDPQHRIFLETGWEALENAGHDPARFDGNIGVFATCGMNTYMMYHLVTNRHVMQTVGEWLVRHTGNDMNFLATRLSYELGLKGPSMNVQTACSSALVAIHVACQSLLNGECDMALAGGSVIALPQGRGYLHRKGEILSPDGHCRAFDADAAGTLFGSGSGVVVLRRLSDALADGDQVLAVIRGSAVNNDGRSKVGYLAPSVEGQSRAVVEALAVSGVHPDTISYVEAHGTGTLVGDPIEMTALTEAYRRFTSKTTYCGVGSLKTNIGHLGEAAGVASFMKTVLSLQHRLIPASLHYRTPNPQIDFAASPFVVNDALHQWTATDGPRRAGVNSLGAGGTNCHVILEEAPDRSASGESRPSHLLTISARTPSALDMASARLADHLETHPDENLADVAYTLQTGRKAFGCRRILVCRNRDEAIRSLRSGQGLHSSAEEPGSHPVVFMFPGQGSQYPAMAAGLYDRERVFREEFDRCAALFSAPGVPGLADIVYGATPTSSGWRLDETGLTQPALFAVEYALARLWMSWGIAPASMIGHSIGEYVAACIAGVFSLDDAIKVVAARASLMQSMPPGAMLGVALPASELEQSIRNSSLAVAASNAPALSVAAGPVDEIQRLEARLRQNGVECQRLHTSHAFHSAMMDPILDRFRSAWASVSLKPPAIPFLSNLTGAWIQAADAMNPDYWVKHLRSTVRFSDGLATILRDPNIICVEVGPGRTLSSLIRQQPARARAIVTSIRHPKEDAADLSYLLTALGKLWLEGQSPDWAAFQEGSRRRVALPTYPFERKRYWIDAAPPVSADVESPAAPGVEKPSGDKQPDVADWFYTPVWKSDPLTTSGQTLEGDTLIFADEIGLGRWLAETLGRLRGTPSAAPFELTFPTAGDLEDARLIDVPRRDPAPGEVEISVRAAALNFADVLKVTGLQPNAPFGMECAGVVSRIGSGVTSFAPGDEVVAIGPDSFRSHVVRDARFVARKPAGLSWADATTIPAAFMTALFALQHVGKLARGERILIHAASGGVGLATLQIARRAGAEIFATAGSQEKRAYLESLGVRHVFSSRTLDFATEISRRTGGAGLDVVLNSLTGEFIPRSLALVGCEGRFLEIGKKEILSPDQLRGMSLKSGVSYHAIDLTATLRDDPELYARLLREAVDGVTAGEWQPPRCHVFPVSEASKAFGLMAAARHIGKVVLDFEPSTHRVVVVQPGERFERRDADTFTVNPTSSADLVALFEELGDAAKKVRRIVHLLNVTPPEQRTSADDRQLDRSFFSPLALAQAIGRCELLQPIDMTIVSTALQQVAGEGVVEPAKAGLLGPARVIPRELPNVKCRSIDVQISGTEWQQDAVARQLSAELLSSGDAATIAYRGSDRWVQHYERRRVSRGGPAALREGGVYLVTGGFGGLGLAVAGHLAATVRAKLVLVGRRQLPERGDWTALLAGSQIDAGTRTVLERVLECERLGAEVLVVSSDVGNRDEMRGVLGRAIGRFGALHGVFHAAGTLGDGLLELKTEETARRVLHPKVRGTLVLDELLSGTPLDFIALFSSVSAVLGLAGQVDYTAANAFLDAFARSKTSEGPTRVISIGWSAWQEVGIAASASKTRRRSDAITPGSSIHPWLERHRAGAEGETVYSTTFNRNRQWVLGEHVIDGSEALLPGTGYLELMRAAAGTPAEGRVAEISNAFFLAPFVVRDKESKDLDVALEPGGQVTIRSGAGEHVTAKIRHVVAPPPARIDLAAIRSRCSSSEAAPDGFLSQTFMRFGPRWANIESIRYGSGEALLTLQLRPEFVDDLRDIGLHPALLDMATGAAQRLIPEFDARSDFYVPFSYGRLVLYRNLPARVISHVRLVPGGSRGTAVFDISLVDESGVGVTDIAGFCMKRVADRQALVTELTRAHAAGDGSVLRRDSGGGLADDMLRNGIAPQEGLDALDRLLSGSTGAEVVVSPVDLNYWTARLEQEARPRLAGTSPGGSAPSTSASATEVPSSIGRASEDVESGLQKIWSDLLGIDRVGVRENFFDLGGHSLLAVRLLARIEKTFHKSVPLQSLFEPGTIESLATLIRGDKAAPQTPKIIVPINEQGNGPAFYCVHSLGGDVFSFLSLGKALGPNQRLYGIQAPLGDNLDDLTSSIEALAARYVDELVRFQPHGPYVLGGWSAGSTIALEMAQQMARSGRPVDLLVALDGAPGNTGAGTSRWNPIYTLKLLRNLPLWISDDLMTDFSLRAFTQRLRNKATAVARTSASGLVGRSVDAAAAVSGFLDMSNWSVQEREFMQRLYGALERYVPRPYAGRVLVYRSRTEPLYHLFEVDAIWKHLAQDVEIVRVSGTHVTLLQERHVPALANDLAARLQAWNASPAPRELAETAP